ncbi:uncharacterized protein LOC134830903 [Culicoides brevitarsis]|uniref:uncharacterized protein LOC134830903 n=1 Tax=Culicoides brevitarsis TaxID=469753 RepID=UPI00307BF391
MSKRNKVEGNVKGRRKQSLPNHEDSEINTTNNGSDDNSHISSEPNDSFCESITLNENSDDTSHTSSKYNESFSRSKLLNENSFEKILEKTVFLVFKNYYVMLSIVCLIVCLLVYFIDFKGYFPQGNIFQIPKSSESRKNCSNFLESSQRYPMYNARFWKELQSGIEHVQNDEPPEPAVFLFVYSDQHVAHKILSHIVSTTLLCLDSKGGAIDVPSSELQSQEVIDDYGKLIEKYKPKLEIQRIMIVKDIQEIPAPVSRAFHFFCDTTSPIVKKSVYFFTMQMSEMEIPSNKNALYETVENRLRELWKSGVDKDKIQPLIARVTDNVLYMRER